MAERQMKRLAQKEANRQKRRMIEKVLSNSKTSEAAFNLNLLVDGWLELDSDPGTFSLLIEDFGCSGAQVDEVYDLDQKFETPVFGFIFLFKWLHNQPTHERSRNSISRSAAPLATSNNPNNDKEKAHDSESGQQNRGIGTSLEYQWSYVEDESLVGQMFFAKQMISNSCATHALISVLLNCDFDELNLGPILTRLKEHTKVMNPENKGYAIGNLPELAKAHNSHASYSSLYNRNRLSSHSSGMSFVVSGNQRTNLQQQKQHEAYHFVSYVPVNNRLYELDGLKNYPIDHGPVGPKEDWTEKFRTVIKKRLSANKNGEDSTTNTEIRYNLMAVVPDRRVCLRAQLKKLKHHQKVVSQNIEKQTKSMFQPLSLEADVPNPPYSPLSNATATASEAGSAFNSPRHIDDSFLSDEDKMDRFFFIKFDSKADSERMKEENMEKAHKDCIYSVETTDVNPLNLTKQKIHEGADQTEKGASPEVAEELPEAVTAKKADKVQKSDEVEPEESFHDAVNNNSNSSSQGKKIQTETSDVSKDPENRDSLNIVVLPKDAIALPNDLDKQTNGLPSKEVDESNQEAAHKDEKYNLSAEPPFEFNILDAMQHVHMEKSTLKDLQALSKELMFEIEKIEATLKEENEKRRKFRIDNSRRTHNYEPFIMTFLSMLAKQGKLADLIEKDLGIISEDTNNTHSSPIAASTSMKINKPSTITTTSNSKQTHNGTSPRKGTPGRPPGTNKPKYKYTPTGRPVGRPRKNPIVPPPS